MNIVDLPEQMEPLLKQAVDDQVFSGAVVGVYEESSGRFLLHAHGKDDYGTVGLDIHEGWVFDLASVTKIFPTSALALRMVLRGELDLDARVADLYPFFRTSHRNQVLVRHLLTHSLDYRFPLSSLRDLDASEILQRVLEHQFRAEPGTLFQYGNASSLVLGLLLVHLTGETLEEQAIRHLWDPMNLRFCGWNPLAFAEPWTIMPTENCPWRNRIVRGEVHDESAYALRPWGPVGSAGVFSTAGDLLRYSAMLLQDGVFEGQRILPAGILDCATHNALPNVPGAVTALGFELANERFMGSHASPRAFGKTGFTGTSVVCDPDAGIAIVALTNFTWPRREASVERIYAFRRALHNLILSDDHRAARRGGPSTGA